MKVSALVSFHAIRLLGRLRRKFYVLPVHHPPHLSHATWDQDNDHAVAGIGGRDLGEIGNALHPDLITDMHRPARPVAPAGARR